MDNWENKDRSPTSHEKRTHVVYLVFDPPISTDNLAACHERATVNVYVSTSRISPVLIRIIGYLRYRTWLHWLMKISASAPFIEPARAKRWHPTRIRFIIKADLHYSIPNMAILPVTSRDERIIAWTHGFLCVFVRSWRMQGNRIMYLQFYDFELHFFPSPRDFLSSNFLDEYWLS